MSRPLLKADIGLELHVHNNKHNRYINVSLQEPCQGHQEAHLLYTTFLSLHSNLGNNMNYRKLNKIVCRDVTQLWLTDCLIIVLQGGRWSEYSGYIHPLCPKCWEKESIVASVANLVLALYRKEL